MTHICTLLVDGDEWHKLSDLVTDYKGAPFTFNTEKRYVLQNLSNLKIMLVESESELGERYNEGNVVMPYEYFNYAPTGEDLYVRGAGKMTFALLTITEEEKAGGSDNTEVLEAVSAVSGQVDAISAKIGDIENTLAGV